MRETSNPSDIWIRINIHETTHIFHDRLSGISRVPSVRYISHAVSGKNDPLSPKISYKKPSILAKNLYTSYLSTWYLVSPNHFHFANFFSNLSSTKYPFFGLCKTYFIEFNLFEFMKYYRSLTIKTRWLKFFSTGEELFSNLDSKLSPSFLGNG